MRLGLIGYPVEHSLSPRLYRELLGDKLTSYDLISCPSTSDVPTLDQLSRQYDGINITSPYKEHFIGHVIILDPIVEKLGAVNALAFRQGEVFATNTDLLAVRAILARYKSEYPTLKVILLGSGVMARITELVARELNLRLESFNRRTHLQLETMDLSTRDSGSQVLVINACSRDFIFKGDVSRDVIFWDYNYNFPSHQNALPQKVKSYSDGQEMLKLQAEAAVRFWEQN